MNIPYRARGHDKALDYDVAELLASLTLTRLELPRLDFAANPRNFNPGRRHRARDHRGGRRDS